MILPYQKILELCKTYHLVYPYVEKSKAFGMTFGVSESGYDITLDQSFIIYPRTLKYLILNSIGFKRPAFCLASAEQKFNIPNDIMAHVADKSSWARQGLFVQNTWIEPGFIGFLTLEISNDSNNIIILNKGQPIAQVIFHRLEESTVKSYNGKYQDQKSGPQLAIFEK